MGNEEFGRFVRELRSQQTFFDQNNYLRLWTQDKLAEEAGISSRTVAGIEQGKVVNLKPHLESLANAFGLTEIQRVDFYAVAGYVYPLQRMTKNKETLRQWLEQLRHPASVRTPLWDFVAFNQYHRVIRGYTAEMLAKLDQGELGPNLLRVLFSPEFRGQTDVRNETWAEEAVWAFRAVSFRYIHTVRYRQILKEMQAMSGFKRAWDRSEDLSDNWEATSSRRPFARVNHPKYGAMEFMSLRIPERYIGEDLVVSVYVPLVSSEENYQSLRRDVVGNEVYTFRDQPLI